MCEYCNVTEDEACDITEAKPFSEDETFRVIRDSFGDYRVEDYLSNVSDVITFCPMCGRKLGGNNERSNQETAI